MAYDKKFKDEDDGFRRDDVKSLKRRAQSYESALRNIHNLIVSRKLDRAVLGDEYFTLLTVINATAERALENG